MRKLFSVEFYVLLQSMIKYPILFHKATLFMTFSSQENARKCADYSAIYYSNMLTFIIQFVWSIAIVNVSSGACCWKDVREDSIDYDCDVIRWSSEERFPSASAAASRCTIVEVIAPRGTLVISKTVHKKA